MQSRVSGRIHAQIDQILRSRDGVWIDVLSVTVDALYKQFSVERGAARPVSSDKFRTAPRSALHGVKIEKTRRVL
jgi:hypothetical protein